MVNKFVLEAQLDADLIAREVPSQRVLELVVCPPDARKRLSRPVLNLALVIDRSGSMSGEKLEYVKRAAIHVLDLLQERDSVAIVAYDSDVTLVSPSVAVTPAIRAELKAKVQAIRSDSMTNLSGGWLRGCEEVAAAISEGSVNRVLLLTDGLANVGITDLEELGMHAGQLLLRRVATSTLGVGHGFNEHLLEHMANQGGGRFYFIATPREIPVIFESEFQELTSITARNVELELTIPVGMAAQVLGSWRSEQANGKLRIWLGDVSAGQRRELYIKLLTPPATDLKELAILVSATALGEGEKTLEAEARISLHYATQVEAEAVIQKVDVMERFSLVEVADRVTEALKLERAGQGAKASQMLKTSLESSAPYLPAPMVADYQDLSARMNRGLDEDTRKSRHSEAYTQKQRRS